jgi:hypothetical protein
MTYSNRGSLRFIGFLILAALSNAASPQEKAADTWLSDTKMATVKSVDISVPLKAGSLTNFALRDANGDGADMAAQYDSPDGKILGTIFIYAPTRPDASLTFLATDESIRRRLGATAQKIEDAFVPVAGVENAARRVIYTGIADSKLSGDPDGRIYSAAAFIGAGTWMIKVRVSGPISRSNEIAKNLDSLVDGLKLGNEARALPQSPIAIADCPVSPDRPAVTITHPPAADALGLAFALDPIVQDEEGAIANPLTPRITAMCRESIEVRDNIALQIFQVTAASSPGRYHPKRVMLYGDAGYMLLAFEDMKFPGQYYVSRHSIGQSFLFGRLTALPSEAEFRSLLFNPEKQPAVIAVTTDYLKKSTNMTVNCNLTVEGCAEDEKSADKP